MLVSLFKFLDYAPKTFNIFFIMAYHRILTIVPCATQYIILNIVLYAILLRASQVMPVVKNQPANAGDIRDAGSIPGSGSSPEGGNGNPLQYSCLENPRDRAVWWTVVHGGHKELDTTEAIEQACMLYSRTWLFIPSICNSLHLLIKFQSIPPPQPSPLATTSLFSLSLSQFLPQR